MTHRFARTAMMLLLAMLSTNMWAQTSLNLSGSGTEQDPYQIGTVANWNNLAEYVAEGNKCEGLYFEMTNDISTVTTPIGKQTGSANSTRQRFAGIFDGGNHTLTVNINSEDGSGQYANTKKCCDKAERGVVRTGTIFISPFLLAEIFINIRDNSCKKDNSSGNCRIFAPLNV